MRKLLFTILLLSSVLGCKNFETKKVSKDELKSQSMKQVDWNQLGRYPSFPVCRKLESKTEKRQCFEKQMVEKIYRDLGNRDIVLVDSVREEVRLYVKISKTGKTHLRKVAVSDSLEQQIPELKKWLEESIENLPELSPGYKRGIPVQTNFQIPIVVQSD